MLDADNVWYHTIDLPDGGHTPGHYDTRALPAQVDWPHGLAGGRCLDVGTFDGFWSFEMERRGAASVTALDIADHTQVDWAYDYAEIGPQNARDHNVQLGRGITMLIDEFDSSVERTIGNVYDLDPEVHGEFDVVFCGALLLHLRDPIRALEAMRRVCRGQLVLVESIEPRMELFVPRIPAARFHPSFETWWYVNTAGLRAMVETAGFTIDSMSDRLLVPFGEARPGQPGRMHSIAARKPTTRGALHRALTATPRPRATR